MGAGDNLLWHFLVPVMTLSQTVFPRTFVQPTAFARYRVTLQDSGQIGLLARKTENGSFQGKVWRDLLAAIHKMGGLLGCHTDPPCIGPTPLAFPSEVWGEL